MTPAVKIRALTGRDLAAVNALKAAVVGEIFSPFAPKVAGALALNPRDPYEPYAFWRGGLAAVSGATVVGVARSKGAWLTDLWVAPAWRGRGAGRRLLRAAENALRRRGVRVARLRTPLKNSPAVAFYRGRGWRIEKLILHETRLDFGVVFIKRL